MLEQAFSRRVFIGGLAVAATAACLSVNATPAAAAPEIVPAPTLWTSSVSQNGWPILTQPSLTPVEGTSVRVSLAEGDIRDVLSHVVRRFNYEVSDLFDEEVTSWCSTDQMVVADFESNYLSGSAIAIRPGAFPIGALNGFFAFEEIVVRDILADCEGIVRWGRDAALTKESHFQIDVPPDSLLLRSVAEKIRSWNAAPGEGAGATDPFLPSRVAVAEDLAQEQEVN